MRPAYMTAHVEFDDFLFAAVGEQANGMPISVLSALALLDFDPREKAAQLQGLATADAVKALAALIVRLPGTTWEPSEAGSIAARLVSLLPSRVSASPAAAAGNPAGRPALTSVNPMIWVVGFVLLAALLAGTMLNGGLRRGGDLAPTAFPPAFPVEQSGSVIAPTRVN